MASPGPPGLYDTSVSSNHTGGGQSSSNHSWGTSSQQSRTTPVASPYPRHQSPGRRLPPKYTTQSEPGVSAYSPYSRRYRPWAASAAAAAAVPEEKKDADGAGDSRGYAQQQYAQTPSRNNRSNTNHSSTASPSASAYSPPPSYEYTTRPRPLDADVVDGLEIPAATSVEYGSAEIVTPSSARVDRLKHKLWDERERLNQGWDSKPASDEHHDDRRRRQQQFRRRSVSPHTPRTPSRVAQRFGAHSDVGVSRHAYDTDDDADNNNDQQQPKRFGNKYYRAAAAIAKAHSPDRSAASWRTPASHSSNMASQNQQQLQQQQQKMQQQQQKSRVAAERRRRPASESGAMLRNAQSQMVPLKNTPSSPRPQYAAAADAALRSPGGASAALQQQHSPSVANLVAKLTAVVEGNQQDPNAALAQIDAILRQESGSQSEPTDEQSDQRRIPAANPPKVDEKRDDNNDNGNDDDNDDENSEESGETTVSSITNPTYQGHPAEKKAPKQYSVQVHSNASSKPRAANHLQAYQTTASSFQRKKAPPTEPDTSSRRRRRLDVTPPATIETNSPSRNRQAGQSVRSSTPGAGWSQKKKKKRPESPIVIEKNHPLDEQNAVAAATATSAEPPTSIAEKLRKWDVMSSSQTHESGGLVTRGDTTATVSLRDVVSHTTEELGSLVTRGSVTKPTPAAVPATRRPSPVPEMQAAQPRDVTMESAVGVEVELQESPDKPRRVSPESSPTNNVSWRRAHHHSSTMADNFDSAWVALPSSTFFAGSPPRGRNSPTFRTSNTTREPGDELRSKSEGASHHSHNHHRIDSMPSGSNHSTRSRTSRSFQRINPVASEPSSNPDAKQRYVPTPPRASRMPTAYDQGSVIEEDDANLTDDGEQTAAAVETSMASDATTPKKRGLRGFLSRRNRATNNTSSLSSHMSLGSSSTNRRPSTTNGRMLDSFTTGRPLLEPDATLGPHNSNHTNNNNNDTEAPPPVMTTPSRRGRRLSKSPSRQRTRSLEERRPRNPSIARKFSRMLRVYEDDLGQKGQF